MTSSGFSSSGFSQKSAVVQAVVLMSYYGFDTKGVTAAELVLQWLEIYEASWIRSAVIEALYQGRYKGVSVEQILRLWLRREQPFPRFTADFERLICRKFPDYFAAEAEPVPEYLDYLDDQEDKVQEETEVRVEEVGLDGDSEINLDLGEQHLSQLLEWEGEELELDSTPIAPLTVLPIVLPDEWFRGDFSQRLEPTPSERETLSNLELKPEEMPLAAPATAETAPEPLTESKPLKGKPESPTLPSVNPNSVPYYPSAIRKFIPLLDKKSSGFSRKLEKMAVDS
ncbi:hypothetical protein K4A83_03950 [Spirulina subsalsa FACHB-351]|uniref:Uncharacterized protein n=1 Tax=Spirulina subsalsa FACHB-351 TaxID=234711 RepID=A0ABT3L1T1_9CYAN|nr:hypothetical protein [Spirulina subsalsa]MCW6035430.1 hypothetical protein [Spirulina subsalsa FACHB-351]